MEKEEEKIISEDTTEKNDIEVKEEIKNNKDKNSETSTVETEKKEKPKKDKEVKKKESTSNTKNSKKEDSEKIKEEVKKEDINKEEKPKTNEVKSKHEKESSVSSKKIILIALSIIFLLFISTIFAILNINNSKIISGVGIENINLSNLTKDEAIKIVNEKLSIIEDVEFSYGEYNTVVKLEEMGLELSAKEAINSAINLGKTNNIIIDNYSILKANIFRTKFRLEIKIDEEKFEETIKNIQAEIPEAIKEYSYVIKDDELIITNGKAGEKVIKEELRKAIITNIREQFNGNIKVVNIITKYEEPEKIDIQKIYSEIYREAKDAYVIEKPFELHKEESGIDFAISIEESKQILKEEKETYVIPLKITKPKIEIADLGDKLFKQTLAKYTTIYDAGNTNRSHNIALAAKSINGTILLPGETFSYNGTIGNPNKANGYKIGTAYVGGKVVDSYGGGVCQVSSTLYNSVLYANLEVVLRYNHSYIVNYVPAGRDATVSYGGKDFKFKNNRQHPVKIVASAKNGVVSVSIMGIKEDTDFEVELTSTVLSTTPRSIIYQNNSSMEEGTQKVIQSGFDGKKSIAYKILRNKDGTIYSKTVLSKDTYKPMARIIERGTKKVPVAEPLPEIQNNITPEITI